MDIGTIISLSIYFLAMIGIGLYSYKQANESASGFLLGGRKLGPAVTALSAGASDMSGWMLMGVPGAMYLSGASSLWIVIGLCVGAWLNYLIVAPRLRVYTETANDAITLPDFFENRFHDNTHLLRIIASIVIVIFFTLYTSSGVVAGGKLFESSFGLSYEFGLYITAGVVVCYTLFGGFMAVSMTDFVQGIIMLIALVIVPTTVILELGGITQTINTLETLDPRLIDLFSDANTGEFLSLIAIISLLSWGLGYFGQPHIIVRFMAINSVKQIPAARRIGMSWMIIALIGAAFTGLFGLAYMESTGQSLDDPETIFIILSQLLFHPLIGGFLLAAILAAIMSTISSQLLVTSSSLTRDFYLTFLNQNASEKQQVLIGRISVLLVAIVAVLLANDRNSSILSLVSNAWAGFGAAFGPLVILSLTWKGINKIGALSGMIAGTVTVLVWIYAPLGENGASLSSRLFEIVPGFLVSFAVTVAVSLISKQENKEVDADFELYQRTYNDE